MPRLLKRWKGERNLSPCTEGIAAIFQTEAVKLSNMQFGWHILLKELPTTVSCLILQSSGLEEKTSFEPELFFPSIKAVWRLIQERKYFSLDELTDDERASFFDEKRITSSFYVLDSGSTLEVQRIPVLPHSYVAARVTYTPNKRIELGDLLNALHKEGIVVVRGYSDIASRNACNVDSLPYKGGLALKEEGRIKVIADVYLPKRLETFNPLPRIQGADSLVRLLEEVERPYTLPLRATN